MKKLFRMFFAYSDSIYEAVIRIKTNVIYKLLFGEIGKNCSVFKPMRMIGPHNIYLGDNVRIYKDSRIESIEEWDGVKYCPKIQIGSGTSFEQNLHLICASNVQIGDDVVVSADVLITDTNHKYQEIDKFVIHQKIEVKDTIIGDFCFIGKGARLLPGTILGRQCIVGTNSVVNGEFPDYSVIVGIPAKIVKRYDVDKMLWRITNNKGDFIDDI